MTVIANGLTWTAHGFMNLSNRMDICKMKMQQTICDSNISIDVVTVEAGGNV
jgi:hypothetical protein